MSDYTPTTETVRGRYVLATVNDLRFPGSASYEARLLAEFDRWLAEHDAALVAEHEQEHQRVIDGLKACWKVDMQGRREAEAERDAAREQLAAAEAVIAELRAAYPPTNSELYMEGGSGPFVDKGMEGYVEAFSVVHSILAAYPEVTP